MEEKKITKDLAQKRLQEIHNSLPVLDPSQLLNFQREIKFLEGWISGYEAKENEIKDDKKPDLKAVPKDNAS